MRLHGQLRELVSEFVVYGIKGFIGLLRRARHQVPIQHADRVARGQDLVVREGWAGWV